MCHRESFRICRCGQLRYFDAKGNLHSDNAWWNSFLIETDVGFEGMGKLLAGPVADHNLSAYAANLEKYIASLPANGPIPPPPA